MGLLKEISESQGGCKISLKIDCSCHQINTVGGKVFQIDKDTQSYPMVFDVQYSFLKHCYCYSVTGVSISPPCPPLTIPPPALKVCSHLVVHVHGSFMHVLCLVPSPSFHECPPPLSLRVTSILLHVYMSVVLFCSFGYFVH